TDVRGNSDKELLNCLYTQGADPIAEQVMRMPVPKLQHACLCSGGCSKCQTKKPSQEYEYLQTKRVQPGNTGQIAAPPIVHDVLSTPGQPLDRATRNFMEPRFGHDFSQVRVHTDVKAAKSALAVNAYAYTLGRNVVFGAGQYSPHTREGQSLLAHELTHVIQQSDGQSTIGIGGPRVQKAPTDTLRRFEVPPNFPEIVIEETVERQLKKKVTSPALWRHFWKVVIKKFALRGGIAVTLAAADGPFPIGDLISLGMTLWMIWDMYQLWDELWREAQLESDLDFEAFLEPEFELELEPTAGSRRTRKQRGFDEGEGYEDDVVPDKEKRKTGRDHRKAADPNRNIDPNDPCLGRKPCSDLGSDYRDASPDDIRGEVINKEGGVYDAGQTVTSTDPFCQGFGTHTTYRRTDAPGQITVVCCECCVPGVSPPFPVRCMLHN
ncbi:MAG: DUF4157 domain-containing protein, partial [Candidatus Tectomicrobia bacterium]|nr:DUF4157 domain-containing protein [Candidatus Tectomicrobia bacterium]